MSSYIAIPISSKVPRDSLGNIHYFENIEDDSASKKYNRIIKEFLQSGEQWLQVQHHDLEVRCPDAEIQRQLDIVYNEGVRLAGVIGTMCLFPTLTWWEPQRPVVTAGAVIQGYADGKEHPMIDFAGIRTDMASVDGCIMWIHRELAQKLKLNEEIPGWHLYDIQCSLQCLMYNFKVGVLNVQVMHKSEGKYDPKVFDSARQQLLKDLQGKVDFPVVSGVTKFKEGLC